MTQSPKLHPLRKWRKAKGWTLEQCANAVGTSRHVWSDWERGRRRPNNNFMPKVRELTGGEVSADDFFPSFGAAA
ncbi:helix-turn-helix domain-containing protein [Novosphingobium decolorationis]|uniref:Helix-turn-helix transcriptional regulator n=1 Tax=Novosphingobium decolorationis TaxID=2698673 RepID=A0ABX8E2X7_9SPHN|nr:helix-turn-helix transcriptional regulator [Novosphingobium decolorationis]